MHISLDSALGRQKRLNSVGESVLQIAPDAAAAYSLRSLTGGDPDVVRVRRESDNTEKDFSGSQIESGEMARWVNEQPTLPLDLRELDTNTGERDGALIEAAAAYSLRKLKEDFTGDVVEVRRNVNGETEGFTAAEVTDGTLEKWVKGYSDLATIDTIDSVSDEYYSVAVNDQQNFNITSNLVSDDLSGHLGQKYITFISPEILANDDVLGKYLVEFNVQVNSGSLGTGNSDGLRISGRYNESRAQVSEYLTQGFNSYEFTLRETPSASPQLFFTSEANSKFDVSISNFNVYKSTVNELPLDQATGAAAAYSLRSLGTNQWEYAGDTLEYESDFSAGTDGWSLNAGWSVVDGFLNCSGATAFTAGKSLPDIPDGAQCRLTLTYDTNVSGVFVIALGTQSSTSAAGGDIVYQQELSGSGTIDVIGEWGTGSGSTLLLWAQGPWEGNISNIKIYENIGDTEYLPSGKYVVQTRRSSDDAVKSFTASEVADGTLTDWVNTEYLYPARGVSETSQTYFNITKTDDRNYRIVSDLVNDGLSVTKFIQILGPEDGLVLGKQRVTFDVDVNSGDISNLMLRLSYRDAQTNLQPVAGSNSFEMVITDDGASPGPSIYFAIHDASSFDVSISNFQVHKIENDGHVKTWYDQSGSDNHAVQTTPANQPKIVDGGSLLTNGVTFDQANETVLKVTGDPVITADYTGTYSAFSIQTVSNSEFGYLYGNASTVGGSSLYNNGNVYQATNKNVASGFDKISKTSSKDLLSAVYNNGDAGLLVDGGGTMVDQGTYNFASGTADFRIGNRAGGSSTGTYLTGSIEEIIIYNSDQSDKRRAIEENIANHYGISLAAFSRDGTVSTWYDQSGSTPANDATQTDPTKQPKIVDAGTYLGEVNFDGTGDVLGFTDIDFSGGDFFVNATYAWDGTADSYIVADSANHWIIRPYASNGFQSRSEDLTQYTISPTDHTFISGELVTTSVFRTSNTLNLAVNGSADDTTNDVTSKTFSCNQLGARAASHYFGDAIKEIIIYNTDQSDNRTAIEANIGETYGITAIPAANDTVNGFVQTWYDQSGSGNDAEQSAASSQPKIVGEVTSGQPHAFLGAIEFDGSQQFQTITLTSSAQPNSMFSVSNTNVAGQTRGIYGTNDKQASYYRSSNKHAIFSSGTGAAPLEGSAYVVDTDYLRFDLFNGANSVVGVNGTTTSGPTGDEVLNRLDIGDAILSGVNPLNGGIKELILYTDDQSSNRPAIEANINNQYDIY